MISKNKSFYRKFTYFFHLLNRYIRDLILNQTNCTKDEYKIFYSDGMKKELMNKKNIPDKFISGADYNSLLINANKVVQNRFQIFSKTYDLSLEKKNNFKEFKRIDWFLDKNNNIHFSNSHWYRIKKKHPKSGDVKFPWEIARFQHAIIIGNAYLITKNEIYTKSFIYQFRDWINNNPARYGIHWANTMEVGIRSATLSLGLLFFIESKELNQEFLNLFLKSMNEHGEHIYNNLENLQTNNSNHYIGNLFGIFFLSLIFPFFPNSKKWQAFAQKELEKEIYDQTFDDGWGFESSTTYHKLITEMFLFVLYLQII